MASENVEGEEGVSSGEIQTETPPNQSEGSDPSAPDVSKLLLRLKEQEKVIKNFQESEQKRKEAQMSELEKATARAKDLDSKLNQLANENVTLKKQQAVLRALQSLGVSRVEPLTRLVNMDSLTVEAGEIVGVEAQIEKLKSEVPELFATTHATTALGSDGLVRKNDKTRAGENTKPSSFDLGRACVQEMKTRRQRRF